MLCFPGTLDNGSSRAGSLSSFFVFQFLTGSGDRSPCAWSLTFSPRVVAGRIVEISESCVDDVGDGGVVKSWKSQSINLGQPVARRTACDTESFCHPQ